MMVAFWIPNFTDNAGRPCQDRLRHGAERQTGRLAKCLFLGLLLRWCTASPLPVTVALNYLYFSSFFGGWSGSGGTEKDFGRVSALQIGRKLVLFLLEPWYLLWSVHFKLNRGQDGF